MYLIIGSSIDRAFRSSSSRIENAVNSFETEAILKTESGMIGLRAAISARP